MKQTKKITYTAVATAIAVIGLAVSAFIPIFLISTLIAALCFFIAFQCGIPHGLMSIAATLIVTFFITGGLVVVSTSFIFAAMLAAPYSILAHFIKRLDYSKRKSALIRSGIIIIFFNIIFAVIVFALGQFIAEFLFGIDLEQVLELLWGIATGYIILAVLGTILMIFYDYTVILAARILNKHLRFWQEQKSVDRNKDVYEE